MSGIVRWEDPPPQSRHRRPRQFNSAAVAEELRGRPNQWAVVAVNPASVGVASGISGARWRPFRPAGSFEAAHRTAENGDRLVYARYIWRSS